MNRPVVTHIGVRAGSIAVASRLGFRVNANLPLTEFTPAAREDQEIVDRALALFCVVAVANNSNAAVALRWLERESLVRALTTEEAKWLESPTDRLRPKFLLQEEALWAFMWALGFLDQLDFSTYCDASLAGMFPRIRDGEASAKFRSLVRLRPQIEIAAQADLAYCLHWALTQSLLEGEPRPGKVDAYVIVERRRALEWLITDSPWD